MRRQHLVYIYIYTHTYILTYSLIIDGRLLTLYSGFLTICQSTVITPEVVSNNLSKVPTNLKQ